MSNSNKTNNTNTNPNTNNFLEIVGDANVGRNVKVKILSQLDSYLGKWLKDVDLTQTEVVNQLTEDERKKLILREFIRCHLSIEYFLRKYTYVNHPRLGIIRMKPFDYQLDLANLIDINIHILDSDTRKEILQRYRFRFDFQKWWKEEIEKNIELLRLVPPELKEQYTLWIHSPFWRTAKHFIVNKSRQVGLSTIAQAIGVKIINFHPSSNVLIVSKSDTDSVEFLRKAKVIYRNLPNDLKILTWKDNDHSLLLDWTGYREIVSGFFALAPSRNVGSGYSPTLLILDELSKWERHVEDAFTSATASLTSGGLLLIIGTPYGIGNLYYRLWVSSIRKTVVSLQTSIEKDGSSKTNEFQTEVLKMYDSYGVNIDNRNTSSGSSGGNLRPYVVHWTQIPDEEFRNRGFKNKLEWYWAEVEKYDYDEKKINQELNLKFFGSGDTVFPAYILEFLQQCNLDLIYRGRILSPKSVEEFIHGYKFLGKFGGFSALPENFRTYIETINREYLSPLENQIQNIKIFEPPKDGELYVIGVDTSEGVGKDYSTAFVFKVPSVKSINSLFKKWGLTKEQDLNYVISLISNITSTTLEEENPELIANLDEFLAELQGNQNNQTGAGAGTGTGTKNLGKEFLEDFASSIYPKCVAEFQSNTISPKDFAKLLILLGTYYNRAYFNIERNKDGLAVISDLADNYFSEDYIINTFDPTKKFPKNFEEKKGYVENKITRQFLLTNFKNYIYDALGADLEKLKKREFDKIECDCNKLSIPKSVVIELLTFEVKPNGRWEHMDGFHDDSIFGFALGLLGSQILQRYLEWLEYKQVIELSQMENFEKKARKVKHKLGTTTPSGSTLQGRQVNNNTKDKTQSEPTPTQTDLINWIS